GGNAWVILSWVRGLQQLGCDVYFVEQVARCTDEEGNSTRLADSIQRAFFTDVMSKYGLGGTSALVLNDGAQTHGMTMSDLCDVARDADLLVNISGHLTLQM